MIKTKYVAASIALTFLTVSSTILAASATATAGKDPNNLYFEANSARLYETPAITLNGIAATGSFQGINAGATAVPVVGGVKSAALQLNSGSVYFMYFNYYIDGNCSNPDVSGLTTAVLLYEMMHPIPGYQWQSSSVQPCKTTSSRKVFYDLQIATPVPNASQSK